MFKWYDLLHYKENPAIYWMTLVGYLLTFQVSAANLRYASGVILSEGPKGEVDPDVKKALETAGYKFIDVPKMQNCVRTTYPFVYMLSLYFAYSSVYPKLMSYVEVRYLQQSETVIQRKQFRLFSSDLLQMFPFNSHETEKFWKAQERNTHMKIFLQREQW